MSLLPQRPGVYIFKNAADKILYIGKAKSLRDRVKSYFRAPIIRLGPKTAQLVSQINSTDHIEVASEMEALLLESRLIKKFHPHYNIASKDGKSPYFIHITSEKFPKPIVNHEPKGAVAGPFLSGLIARKILRQFRRTAPYCVAIDHSRPCLYSQLGLCNPCPGNPATNPKEYLKNIVHLKRLLRGQFKSVHTFLKKSMQQYSKIHDFEAAAQTRDQIKNLDLLMHTPIPPDEYIVNPNLTADRHREALEALRSSINYELTTLNSLHRIEMYDIAHLAGTAATGAMTVAIDGEISPQNYRHFKIQHPSHDDVDMLREVLERRLKRIDWPPPDLIVLDGGKPQLSVVKGLFPAEGGMQPCPIIALTKKEEIIYTSRGQEIKLPRNHPGLQLLQHLRDEAHRFSRRLHHLHRRRIIK